MVYKTIQYFKQKGDINMSTNIISQSRATTLAYLLESYIERSNLLTALSLVETSHIDRPFEGTITAKRNREDILARIKDLKSDIANSMEHYRTEFISRIDPNNDSTGSDILYKIDRNLEILIKQQGNEPISKEGFVSERKFAHIDQVEIPYTMNVTNTRGNMFSVLLYSDGTIDVQYVYYCVDSKGVVDYLTKVHNDISDKFSKVSRYNELIYRIIQNTISLKHIEAKSPEDENLRSNKKYNDLRNTLMFLKISLTKWENDGKVVGDAIEEHIDNLYLDYLKDNKSADILRPTVKLAYGTTYECMSYKVCLEDFSVTFKCYDNGFRVEL